MPLKKPLSLLALAAALLAAPACAKPVPVAPAAVTMRLGAFRLVSLRDALNVVPNDGSVFGIDETPGAVAAVLRAAHAPADRITLGVDALLVEEPGRTILIDTGLGPSVHGALMQSLARAGVAPDAISEVLLTHSHGDHTGGLVTADGALAFPKAVIRLSAPEWRFMQSHSPAKLVAAITPKVRPFEPGTEVAPGIRSVAIPGHTPGHCGYQIESQGHRLFDMGDTAHSSIVSLARPDWTIGYDQDKQVGRASRVAWLARLAATHEAVFGPHMPFPGIGRIVAQGDGYVWQPGRP